MEDSTKEEWRHVPTNYYTGRLRWGEVFYGDIYISDLGNVMIVAPDGSMKLPKIDCGYFTMKAYAIDEDKNETGEIKNYTFKVNELYQQTFPEKVGTPRYFKLFPEKRHASYDTRMYQVHDTNKHEYIGYNDLKTVCRNYNLTPDDVEDLICGTHDQINGVSITINENYELYKRKKGSAKI